MICCQYKITITSTTSQFFIITSSFYYYFSLSLSLSLSLSEQQIIVPLLYPFSSLTLCDSIIPLLSSLSLSFSSRSQFVLWQWLLWAIAMGCIHRSRFQLGCSGCYGKWFFFCPVGCGSGLWLLIQVRLGCEHQSSIRLG